MTSDHPPQTFHRAWRTVWSVTVLVCAYVCSYVGGSDGHVEIVCFQSVGPDSSTILYYARSAVPSYVLNGDCGWALIWHTLIGIRSMV